MVQYPKTKEKTSAEKVFGLTFVMLVLESTNIFSPAVLSVADAVCITTNCVTKKNGEAVMGAGVALSARRIWPDLSDKLGYYLRKYANSSDVADLRLLDIKKHEHSGNKFFVIALPTKIHWRDPSPKYLVMRSLRSLRQLSEILNLHKVYLPPPGCSNGGLKWNDIKEEVEEILPENRFRICFL